jgi:Spy/CpxP family protein refolding chaperone
MRRVSVGPAKVVCSVTFVRGHTTIVQEDGGDSRKVEIRKEKPGMKKTPAKIGVMTFTLVLCMALAAPAMGYKSALPRESGGEPYEYMLLTLLQLRLSEPQKRDIAVTLNQYRKDVRKAIVDVMEARQRLSEAIESDSPDDDTIRQASRQAVESEEQLALLKVQVEGQIKGLLTPEQQTIMRDLKADVSEKIRERLEYRLSLLDQWIEDHSR